MASGLIKGTVSQNDTYYDSYIYWREDGQSIDNNTTTLYIEVLIDSTSSGWNWNGTVSNFSATLNGTTYTASSFNSNSASGWTYSTSTSPTGKVAERIWSNTITVTHDTDGGKKTGLKCSFSLPSGGWGPGNVYVDGTATLTTIPRASQPTLSASSTAMGSSVTIYTNRASTGFTHTLVYSFGGDSANIAFSVGDSHTWTIPKTLANQIPSSTSGWGTIICHTYSGSTLIGSKEVTFTATVPNTTEFQPTFSSITHSEGDTVYGVSTKVGAYVQSLSKLNMAISGASGAYSSTISAYEITFEGTTHKTGSATSGVIKGSGILTITGKVTDSRGRTHTKTANVTVLAYSQPIITSFTASRCNSDGTANELGTSAKVVRHGSVTSLVVGGVEKNSMTFSIFSRLRGTTNWGTAKYTYPTSSTVLSTTSQNILSTYDIVSSYDFKFEITDKFYTTLSLTVLSSGAVAMSWSQSGVGIGKVWESGALDVGGNINFTGGISNMGSGNTSVNYMERTSTSPAFYADQKGTGDIARFRQNGAERVFIKNDGAIETQGDITATHGKDVRLKATTTGSGADVGDIVFLDSAETEIGRIWRPSATQFAFRFSATDPAKYISGISAQGTNTNGSYIRYDDGTQICFTEYKVSSFTIPYAYGVLYQNAWDWTFPASFINTPTVSCSHAKYGTGASWGAVSAVYKTYASLRLLDAFQRSTAQDTQWSAVAIGKWK